MACDHLKEVVIATAKRIAASATEMAEIMEKPLSGETFEKLAKPTFEITKDVGYLHGSIGGLAVTQGVIDASKMDDKAAVVILTKKGSAPNPLRN